jgi:hypothetical protein
MAQLHEHRRAFRRTVKWRAGSDARISTLKRQYGWDRTRRDGLDTHELVISLSAKGLTTVGTVVALVKITSWQGTDRLSRVRGLHLLLRHRRVS